MNLEDHVIDDQHPREYWIRYEKAKRDFYSRPEAERAALIQRTQELSPKIRALSPNHPDAISAAIFALVPSEDAG